MDLRAVVRHYKEHFRSRARAELDSFAEIKSLEVAVRRAALAMTWDAKRFPHQRRLKEKDLDRAEQKLVSRIADIERASSFAALFDVIERAVGSLGGLGELYVYDTALRIGAQKRTLPQRAYLHAGARQGAKALGLEVAGVVGFFKSELPEALRELEAHEIEDVLCIYKLYFTGEQRDLDDEATCWVDEEIEDEMSPRTIKRNC